MRTIIATITLAALARLTFAADTCNQQAVNLLPSGLAVYTPNTQAPVTAGQPFTITWDATQSPYQTVSILFLKGPSSNVLPNGCIANSIPNTGSYVWNVPSDLTAQSSGYGLSIIADGSGDFQYSTQFGVNAGSGSSSVTSTSTTSGGTSSASSQQASTTSASSAATTATSATAVSIVPTGTSGTTSSINRFSSQTKNFSSIYGTAPTYSSVSRYASGSVSSYLSANYTQATSNLSATSSRLTVTSMAVVTQSTQSQTAATVTAGGSGGGSGSGSPATTLSKAGAAAAKPTGFGMGVGAGVIAGVGALAALVL